MIPPLTDVPVAAPGATIEPAPAIRFADLLQGMSAGDRPADVQAERFNQYGFFGTTPIASTPAVASVVNAIGQPVMGGEPRSATMIDVSASDGAASAPREPIAPVRTAAPTPPRMATGDRFAPVPVGRPSVATPGIASRPVPPRSTAVVPARPALPFRPRPVPAGAFVAVAAHAVGQGIEVAAHVAGLDERERAALTEEVAALLSAHGYSPACIMITAAVRGPYQDRR